MTRKEILSLAAKIISDYELDSKEACICYGGTKNPFNKIDWHAFIHTDEPLFDLVLNIDQLLMFGGSTEEVKKLYTSALEILPSDEKVQAIEAMKKKMDNVNALPLGVRKYKFIQYCRENIELANKNFISRQEAAYNICGSANYIFVETETDYDQIRDLACDLELPTDFANEPKGVWEELGSLVKKESLLL